MRDAFIICFIVCLEIPFSLQNILFNAPTTRDYLLITANQTVLRIDLKTREVKDIGIAGTNLIEFDIKHNQLFYIENNTGIVRKRFNINDETERLVAGSVRCLSYDWISELLYFVDLDSLTIKAVRTTLGTNRMIRTIYNFPFGELPKSLVVHPKYGYLYWFSEMPSITRANLDGSHFQLIVRLGLISDITIDYQHDRVYWTDWSSMIGNCDLNGKDRREIQMQKTSLNLIAVIGDQLYCKGYSRLEMDIIYSTNVGMAKCLIIITLIIIIILHTTKIMQLFVWQTMAPTLQQS